MTLPCDDSTDWLDDLEPHLDPYTSHVLLYRGFDLFAAGISGPHDIAPCLLCAPLQAEQAHAVILDDERLHWGRHIHFVCCGNCGTRGPWGASESMALKLWNAAHSRYPKPKGQRQNRGKSAARLQTAIERMDSKAASRTKSQ